MILGENHDGNGRPWTVPVKRLFATFGPALRRGWPIVPLVYGHSIGMLHNAISSTLDHRVLCLGGWGTDHEAVACVLVLWEADRMQNDSHLPTNHGLHTGHCK